MQIVDHRFARKCPQFGLRRTRIQNVWRMRHQPPKPMRRHQFPRLGHVARIDRLRRTATRIPQKKRKRIRVDRFRLLDNRTKTLRYRQMRSNIHLFFLYSRCLSQRPPLMILGGYGYCRKRQYASAARLSLRNTARQRAMAPRRVALWRHTRAIFGRSCSPFTASWRTLACTKTKDSVPCTPIYGRRALRDISHGIDQIKQIGNGVIGK